MPSDKGAFPYLFKNDFRLQFRRWLTRKWTWGYFGAFALLLLAAMTIWGGRSEFKPEYLLYVCFAFPFIFFGISFGMVKREWSGSTFGWWLTLPYSRSKLLFAKFAASAVQALAVLIVYFGSMLLLELYNLLIHGFDSGVLQTFVKLEGEYLVVVLLVSPFMLALGLFFALIARSRLRPLAPLCWILFGTMGNVFNWLNVSTSDDGAVKSIILFDGSAQGWIWMIFPGVWLLAALLFAASVGVAKKQLVL